MKTALTGLLVGFIHQYMAVVGIQIRHLCFGKYGGCTFQSYVEPSVAGGIWQLMMSQDIVRKAEKSSKKIPENGDSLVQGRIYSKQKDVQRGGQIVFGVGEFKGRPTEQSDFWLCFTLLMGIPYTIYVNHDETQLQALVPLHVWYRPVLQKLAYW
ncbi:hypothetical protein DFH05DRAFT_1463636 [Lentinula detonsa]|uniref:Uncharacterized protein n=1 Tax=Lentinula detonsa TaxID=2804962 RepID=A0A9W8TTU4_9AGAR|nr:hypothetical protein DFH05DRAFT_1463636 [Lentinula detonsa]